MINIIGRFFRRLVVYQVIFFWSVLKLRDLTKYSNELKDKISANLASISLKTEFFDFILEHPESLTKYLTYLEIAFAVLALFGLRFGAYVTAGFCLMYLLIYFNPILPENRLALFNIKIELLFSLGVIIVILVDCCHELKKKPKTEDEITDQDELEESREPRKKKKYD
jgi:uncharacterized membrane protein YphA (DoxX/SURF4 family)